MLCILYLQHIWIWTIYISIIQSHLRLAMVALHRTALENTGSADGYTLLKTAI